MLDAATDGFLAIDRAGNIVFANRPFAVLFGYHRDDLIGRSVASLVPARMGEQYRGHLAEFLASPSPRQMGSGLNVTGVRRDGSEFLVDVSLAPLETDAGLIVIAAVRDLSDRTLAEEAKHWRENEFRARIDGLPDYAVCKLDPEGRVISWNAGAERVSHWTAAEIVGKHYSRLFPREDVAAGRPDYELREALRAGHFEDENWRVRKDGSKFWANVVIAPLRDRANQLLGFAKITRDMTERKRIADSRERLISQLQTERGRLATILDEVPTAVVIAEAPSGRLVFGNCACERITGEPFRPSERIEDSVIDWHIQHLDGQPMPPDDLALERSIRHGEAVTGQEFALRRHDGSWLTLSGNTAPLRDDSGTITGAVGVYSDITAIRQTEEAQRLLAEAGQVFAASLDLGVTLEKVLLLTVPRRADWCVVELIADDRSVHRPAVVHADPRKQPLFDQLTREPPCTGEFLLATRIVVTRAPELVAEVSDEWVRQHTHDSGDASLVRALGTRSLIVVPLIARDTLLGAITMATGDSKRYSTADFALAQEIARRAATAIDNARLYDSARQAIAERNELLATVSHDLKNPIAAMLLNAEIVQRSLPEDTPARRNIASIRRSAHTMQKLIGGLMQGARIEAGAFTLERVPADIAPLIQEAVDRISPAAAEHSVRIDLQIEPGLPQILVDAEQLARVFMNLLDNAARFTPVGGLIAISARRQGEFVRFQIADNGAGIAIADLDHVFERYWRGAGQHPGAGLGLYISKAIVEAHGGSICVESRPGEGTSFALTIPVSGGDTGASTP